MADKFELDRRELFGFLDSLGLSDTPTLDFRSIVAIWAGEDQLKHADSTTVLAWFTYLLGITPSVARPEGFGPHALIGVAGRGPRYESEFLIILCKAGGVPVCDVHTTALELWEDQGSPSGYRLVGAIAEAILQHVRRLLPAAEAAAATGPA